MWDALPKLVPTAPADLKIPVLANYLFSAPAGTLWYFQFFFYSMGETQIGKYRFASWPLHMAGIIIFRTTWGWILHEWKRSLHENSMKKPSCQAALPITIPHPS